MRRYARPVRLPALVLALAALAAGGCGGDEAPDEDPAAFATALVRDLERGDAGDAWERLHPAHQEAVPRALYVRCEAGDGFGGTVESLRVARVEEAPWKVPGETDETDSTAVTLDVALLVPGAELERFDLTAHLFAVDGRWAWVIGEDDYAAYAAGDCPD